MEPIITPEIEALLKSYCASTLKMANAAQRGKISPTEIGDLLNDLFEKIISIERITNDLVKKFNEIDKTEFDLNISTIFVRAAACSGICRELRQRNEQFLTNLINGLVAEEKSI